ncbi:MAG: hypothetical protein IJB48_02200, partial [Clostridia bacterium]|nr:hypothetical protein [Clostridia bacterium]
MTGFYRKELIDSGGAAERIWKMHSILNAGQGNGIGGGADVKNASPNESDGGISYGKSPGKRADVNGPGNIGKSGRDTSENTADRFEQLIANEVLSNVGVTKVKMRQFPSRKDSGGSDTNQYCTLWSYQAGVFAGDQTIVFRNDKCYVIEKYDNIEFKYLIVEKINFADYKAVRGEILADARN